MNGSYLCNPNQKWGGKMEAGMRKQDAKKAERSLKVWKQQYVN